MAICIGSPWVHARCRENAATIAAMRRSMKAHPPRSVSVNQEWGIDLTTVHAGGHRQLVFAALDHGSRLGLRLKVLTRKCAWTLLSEFCAACAAHGAPLAVRTDNEAMFTGKLWIAFFTLAGIRRQRIDPGCPWQNGRIERFFGTLKPLLRQLSIPTAADLQIRLDEFAAFYNEVRVHQSLGGLTPAEVWRGKSIHTQRVREEIQSFSTPDQADFFKIGSVLECDELADMRTGHAGEPGMGHRPDDGQAGGRRHLVFATLDHGSRLALRLTVLTRKCAWTLLSEFCAACAAHGAPLAVRTDNEAMFTGKLWIASFTLAGIRRQRIDPGCPWQNGRVERFFGTLKPLLGQLSIPTAVDLQMRLDEFAVFYNEVRVHQSLGDLMPAEV